VKGFVFIGVAVFLLLTAEFPAQSHSNQLLLGTQLHLVLLNGLTTPVARDADPFAAVVPEPVYLGGQLILPGRACIRPDRQRDELKSFSGFHGLAVTKPATWTARFSRR